MNSINNTTTSINDLNKYYVENEDVIMFEKLYFYPSTSSTSNLNGLSYQRLGIVLK